MSVAKRRIKRSNRVSQAVLNLRMREIWIDGYGLLPYPTPDISIDQLREALHELVCDQDYWSNLKVLAERKRDVAETMELLKKQPKQSFKYRRPADLPIKVKWPRKGDLKRKGS